MLHDTPLLTCRSRDGSLTCSLTSCQDSLVESRTLLLICFCVPDRDLSDFLTWSCHAMKGTDSHHVLGRGSIVSMVDESTARPRCARFRPQCQSSPPRHLSASCHRADRRLQPSNISPHTESTYGQTRVESILQSKTVPLSCRTASFAHTSRDTAGSIMSDSRRAQGGDTIIQPALREPCV